VVIRQAGKAKRAAEQTVEGTLRLIVKPTAHVLEHTFPRQASGEREESDEFRRCLPHVPQQRFGSRAASPLAADSNRNPMRQHAKQHR
jgi:hypothetical protein